MRLILLGSLLFGGAGLAGALWANDPPLPGRFAPAVNVNSRYIVEAVDIDGYNSARLSDALRDRIRALIGQSYDIEAIDAVAKELRKEIHAKAVTQHLAKGSNQESVRLVYNVTRRTAGLDISVPKFLYHSQQGWSGQVEASAAVTRNQTLTFGIVSDGDELTERFAGIYSRYENLHVGSSKVRFQFLFEDYHEQWNAATLRAIENPSLLTPQQRIEAPDIYRSRRNFQPVFTFVVAKPLLLTIGASFAQMAETVPAIQTESANAVIFGLRFHKQMGTTEASTKTFDAAYEIKSAMKALNSDYVYTRHRWEGGYNWTKGHHSVSDVVTAGFISGRAPFYDLFVVGTSSLLRGWNRYEIDPLGGNRLLHNSIEYRYRFAGVFYDCGSLWSLGSVPTLRHSLGVGVRQSIFSLAVAFPVRTDGRIDPTLLVGMNY